MYANEALKALEGVTGLSRILAVEAHLTLGQFEKARDEADALLKSPQTKIPFALQVLSSHLGSQGGYRGD